MGCSLHFGARRGGHNALRQWLLRWLLLANNPSLPEFPPASAQLPCTQDIRTCVSACCQQPTPGKGADVKGHCKAAAEEDCSGGEGQEVVVKPPEVKCVCPKAEDERCPADDDEHTESCNAWVVREATRMRVRGGANECHVDQCKDGAAGGNVAGLLLYGATPPRLPACLLTACMLHVSQR